MIAAINISCLTDCSRPVIQFVCDHKDTRNPPPILVESERRDRLPPLAVPSPRLGPLADPIRGLASAAVHRPEPPTSFPRPTRGRPSSSVRPCPSAGCRLRRPRPHPHPLGQRSGVPGGHGGRGSGALPGRQLPGEGPSTGSTTASGRRFRPSPWPGPLPPIMRGRQAEATRRAGKRAVDPLLDLVQPWASRSSPPTAPTGCPLVLATTSPFDLVSALWPRPRASRG